jgi:hypothetical protein
VNWPRPQIDIVLLFCLVRMFLRRRSALLVSAFLVGVLFSSSSYAGATREYLAGLISEYRKSTCSQIAAEAQATALRAVPPLARTKPYVRIKKDSLETSSLTIRWPDLSALDKESAETFKDHMLAIEEASIEKQCSIHFEAQ